MVFLVNGYATALIEGADALRRSIAPQRGEPTRPTRSGHSNRRARHRRGRGTVRGYARIPPNELSTASAARAHRRRFIRAHSSASRRGPQVARTDLLYAVACEVRLAFRFRNRPGNNGCATDTGLQRLDTGAFHHLTPALGLLRVVVRELRSGQSPGRHRITAEKLDRLGITKIAGRGIVPAICEILR